MMWFDILNTVVVVVVVSQPKQSRPAHCCTLSPSSFSQPVAPRRVLCNAASERANALPRACVCVCVCMCVCVGWQPANGRRANSLWPMSATEKEQALGVVWRGSLADYKSIGRPLRASHTQRSTAGHPHCLHTCESVAGFRRSCLSRGRRHEMLLLCGTSFLHWVNMSHLSSRVEPHWWSLLAGRSCIELQPVACSWGIDPPWIATCIELRPGHV